MSETSNCNCACPSPVVTEVPGSPGENGENGTNGTNAYDSVQESFVVPAIGGSISVVGLDNQWAANGQNLFVEGAGTFRLTNKSGTTIYTLLYLDYVGNDEEGSTVTAGAKISASGTQPEITLPLPIADGGTEADTKAGAQLSLGLGQDATQVAVSGLTQAITNAAAIVAGATVTVPANGIYLVLGRATLSLAGVTFASSRTLTLRIQNTTTSSTVTSAAKATQIQTTANFPSSDIWTPLLTSELTGNDVLELQVSLDTVNSAGTASITAAELVIIPLSLS